MLKSYNVMVLCKYEIMYIFAIQRESGMEYIHD